MTPIFIAAAEGFKELVGVFATIAGLITLMTLVGSPLEHACLRGHLDVADMLKPGDDELLMHDINNPNNNKPQKTIERLARIQFTYDFDFIICNWYNHKTVEFTPPNGSFSTSSIDKLPESNASTNHNNETDPISRSPPH